jgi:hypothetical protein
LKIAPMIWALTTRYPSSEPILDFGVLCTSGKTFVH